MDGAARNSSRTASNLRRKIAGTPGRIQTLRTTTTGQVLPGPPGPVLQARAGRDVGHAQVALVQPLAVARPQQPFQLGVADERHPEGRATAASVTSSWVGPTPPEVNTLSNRAARRAHARGDVFDVVGDDLDPAQRHARARAARGSGTGRSGPRPSRTGSRSDERRDGGRRFGSARRAFSVEARRDNVSGT